jgi:hypothetical protein
MASHALRVKNFIGLLRPDLEEFLESTKEEFLHTLDKSSLILQKDNPSELVQLFLFSDTSIILYDIKHRWNIFHTLLEFNEWVYENYSKPENEEIAEEFYSIASTLLENKTLEHSDDEKQQVFQYLFEHLVD